MRKSLFITLFLSIVPGLGHLYLGLPYRAMGFMAAFFGWTFCLIGLEALTGMCGPEVILFMAPLPVIWFYNVFDALSLNQRMRTGEAVPNGPLLGGFVEKLASREKDAMWTLLFSIVPGAGQMYLGWQDRGLQLMLAFFLCMSLVGWARLSLFAFLLPVIWFYAFFDALQLASKGDPGPAIESGLLSWAAKRQRWMGLGLIAFGCIMLFDQVVSPLMNPYQTRMLRTAIIAAAFIAGGIRLAAGRPVTPASEPRPVEDPSAEVRSCGDGE